MCAKFQLVFCRRKRFIAQIPRFVADDEGTLFAVGNGPKHGEWRRMECTPKHVHLEQIGIRHGIRAHALVEDEVGSTRRFFSIDAKCIARAPLLERSHRLPKIKPQNVDDSSAQRSFGMRNGAIDFEQ